MSLEWLLSAGSLLAVMDQSKVGTRGKAASVRTVDAPTDAGATGVSTLVTLNMQRMPQRPQRRLLHGLTQCRVGVDGAGHVFQRRAHLQRM
jgi:hypothetical protein